MDSTSFAKRMNRSRKKKKKQFSLQTHLVTFRNEQNNVIS